MLGSNKDQTPTQTIPPQKPNQPTAPPKPASTRKPEPPEPKPTNTGAIPKMKTWKKPGIEKIRNETTARMSDLRKYFKPRVEQPTELNSDQILNFVLTAPLESEAEENQNCPTDCQTKPEGSQSSTAKGNN